MATIGEQFKAARETKGVSESEAATATKILTKVIVAMEADDFSAMAAPTYAKGFIRLYAEYLNLESAPLVEEYTQKHSIGPRKLIDENSQLEQNSQDSRIFPSHTKRSSSKPNPFAGLVPRKGILSDRMKKIPLGPLKDIRVAAGIIAGVLVLSVLIGSISTCARDKGPAKETQIPAVAPARMLLDESLPDLYLTEPGKIEAN